MQVLKINDEINYFVFRVCNLIGKVQVEHLRGRRHTLTGMRHAQQYYRDCSAGPPLIPLFLLYSLVLYDLSELVPYRLAVCTSCGTCAVQIRLWGDSIFTWKGEHTFRIKEIVYLYLFSASLLPCALVTLSTALWCGCQLYNTDKSQLVTLGGRLLYTRTSWWSGRRPIDCCWRRTSNSIEHLWKHNRVKNRCYSSSTKWLYTIDSISTRPTAHWHVLKKKKKNIYNSI